MSTFATALTDFATKAKANIDVVVRKTLLDVGTRVVMRSPVGDATLWKNPPPPGYVGGRFRANWQYGYGAAPADEMFDKSPPATSYRSPQDTVDALRAGIAAAPLAGIHYIANNLPYGERLEDGWSSQAPAGMVGLTVLEFPQLTFDNAAAVNK